MGEIHELFVLALSLVWFAGVTPDKIRSESGPAAGVRKGLGQRGVGPAGMAL